MSRHAEIVRYFGDDFYRFRLALGQLRAIEDKRNAPATVIFARVSTGSYWVDDQREIILQGLIGGEDLKPPEAMKKVERYHDQQPLYANMKLATDVLHAAVIGPPPAEDKKKEEGESGEEKSSGSTFGESTATVQ